jgi:thiol-disulfide isomerase/thioredoxin
MKSLSGAAAVASLFILVAGPTAADVKPAPDVTLQAEDGTPVRLGQFAGRIVLIDFWASWCAPCKTSFPALDALYREYRPRGVEVLAVNLDERRRDADAFVAARPHEMPVLYDVKGDAPRAFGVKGMPSSFIIDRGGTIRFTHMGYSANIGQQYRQELDLLLSSR